MFVGLENASGGASVGGGREQDVAGLLAAAVAQELGIDPDRLRRRGRGDARTAFARQVAIYVACTCLGLSFTDAGRLFGRDRTTAAHACRCVEERRDEAWADALVERVGRVAGGIAARGSAFAERAV